MENPVAEIPTVIRLLTQAPPSLQEKTINRYFTSSAAFVHPFCQVWSYNDSRWAIKKVYQWYKVMSPRIELEVHSVAYDEANLKLYVQMSQIFTIWIVPFHVAPVTLTTVLDLTTDSGDRNLTNGDKTLYYIQKQEDLYQPTQFVKFLFPHFGHWFVRLFHFFATLFCVWGAWLFWPFIWLEENGYIPNYMLKGGNLVSDIHQKADEIKGD
ncbi:uncharacterized protein LDX57_012768 [Aspergillus melleus]|uniref:uncharacterized protein n=1 Tax=Aspergillus melleus TaxID=138277 RepID=UPI001E8E81BF|nr:uncharacterized protein LDX57_012768 [Aspergillus melleus]KAH8435139.1 hypothetical protein LDX57_012768 [Aspergillus melleus]